MAWLSVVLAAARVACASPLPGPCPFLAQVSAVGSPDAASASTQQTGVLQWAVSSRSTLGKTGPLLVSEQGPGDRHCVETVCHVGPREERHRLQGDCVE